MRWLSLCALLFVLAAGRPALTAEPAVNADLMRLHDDLHLSPDQEAAWRDYTLAIGPDGQAEARRRAAAELLPSLPTPRRLALMEATLAGEAADFHRHALAVAAFYNRLTPAQQRTFDFDTLPRPERDEDARSPS